MPLLLAVSSERTECEFVLCFEKDLVRVGRWFVGQVGGKWDAPFEWVVRARDVGETGCADPETKCSGLAVADRGNDWKECAGLAHGAVMLPMLVW